MKKKLLPVLACVLLCGCSNHDEVENPVGSVAYTFALSGDFVQGEDREFGTRASLVADDKNMTDVWVLDYMNGQLVQQIHQEDNSADDFGSPSLNLAYGTHHIYFIVSRGQGASLDTSNHIISFTKPLDNFYKDLQLNVIATSNGQQAVTLDRISTKLKLSFTDAVAMNASTINITPHTWYYGWDYVNAVPADAHTDETVTIAVPANFLGSNSASASVFGFSGSEVWATDVAVDCRTVEGDVIGSAVISNAPFKANRVTEYSGPLFGSSGAMSLSLSTVWDDSYEGVW